MRGFILIILFIFLLATNSCVLIFNDVDYLNYYVAGEPRWINETEFNVILYADYYDNIPCKVFRINPYENTCKEILYYENILYNPQSIGKYYTIQSNNLLYIFNNENDEITAIDGIGDYSLIDSNAEYVYGSTGYKIIRKRIGDTLRDTIANIDSLDIDIYTLCYIDLEEESAICANEDGLYEISLVDSSKSMIFAFEELIDYGIEFWYLFDTVLITKDIVNNNIADVRFKSTDAGTGIVLQIERDLEGWSVIGEIPKDSINRNASGDFISINKMEVVVKNSDGEVFFKKTFNRDGE